MRKGIVFALVCALGVSGGAAGLPGADAAKKRAKSLTAKQKRALARKAKRVIVRRAIPRDHTGSRKVTCRRKGPWRRRRFSCRWRGERRLSPNRYSDCRGRHRVVLPRRKRARLRALARRKCSALARPVEPRLGLQDHSVRSYQLSAAQSAELVEATGAGIYRTTLDWRYLERVRDQYAWGDYDRIYKETRARGLRPLWILLFAPSWARNGELCVGEIGCRYPPARHSYGQWREVAGQIATRYPESAGIEIWNEPNEASFWQPGPDPRRYTEVLREAYLGVKRANPSMPVISGGLSGRTIPAPGSMTLESFLGSMYSNGGRGHFDAIGIHPYPASRSLKQISLNLAATRAVKGSNGEPRKPIWVTETGFTTTGGEPLRVSELEQARGIREIYDLLMHQPDVDALVYHQLIDPPGGPTSHKDSGFGFRRPDNSPKPAFCTLIRTTRTGVPCP